ncbi:hypothetical protein [Martelella endophytica]|nr:hypothetical protein [Martelella endophytica]
MKTKQHFTEQGVLGVFCLFLGPIVTAGGWYLALKNSGQTYGDLPPIVSAMVILGGGFISLASIPLMLVGREFTSSDG